MSSPRKVYGLVISINYINSTAELRGCINDGDAFTAYLRKTFPEMELVQLYEGLATKANIEYHLENLTRLADNALVFVYYSGHGARVVDHSGDEVDGRDECIIPVDYLTSGVIVDDWIYFEVLKKFRASNFVFFVHDNCNAGTICDLKYSYTQSGGQVINNVRENTDCTCVSVCSSSDEELSYETVFEGKFRGVFTKRLCDLWTTLELSKESLAFYINPQQTVTVSYSHEDFSTRLNPSGIVISDPKTWTSIPSVSYTNDLKLFYEPTPSTTTSTSSPKPKTNRASTTTLFLLIAVAILLLFRNGRSAAL